MYPRGVSADAPAPGDAITRYCRPFDSYLSGMPLAPRACSTDHRGCGDDGSCKSQRPVHWSA